MTGASSDAGPLASVVIATRNRVHLLADAVASVIDQTLREWELIVVDDASEDETRAWLASCTDARLRQVPLDARVERSRARNHGCAQARGDFLLFLDDDDRLRPMALERLVTALADPRRGAAVQAIGGRIDIDRFGHRRRVPHVRVPRVAPVWPEMLGGWWWPGTGQCLFRRGAFEAIGGYDPDINASEDQEIQFRLSAVGPALFVPGAVLEVRSHPGQERDPRAAEIAERFHAEFAAQLTGDDAARAARLRAAHRVVLSGLQAGRERRFGRALVSYVKAARVAPELLRSPLTRRLVVRAILASAAKALLPPLDRLAERRRRRRSRS